jgi:kynurenine formamidase
MENLLLEELARDHCYAFAFLGIPLKFTGATGSPVRPLALAEA